MRSIICFAFSSVLVGACGGGGTTPTPPTVDAPAVTPDAPHNSGLTGLGQTCSATMTCPTNADQCIGFTQGGPTYCTPKCLTAGAGKTNAQGQLTSTTPAPDNTKCTGAFTGTVGMPQCGVILAITPADNPLKANTNYTGIDLGCVIVCGTGNTCPTGMTCNTTQMICLPM